MTRKSIITALVFALAVLGVLAAGKDAPSPIKKIVLLCMENHSYDNMLGFMNEPIGDLHGEEFNYADPQNKLDPIYVHDGADLQTIPDPPHTFVPVQGQLYGTEDYPANNSRLPDNSGFAWQYKKAGGNPQNVMNIYSPTQLPILTTLARNFQLHKRWFSPAPTSTDPNKFFLYAAQSGGLDGNCWNAWYCNLTNPIEMNTIFDDLDIEGYSWSIHYMDFCEAMGVTPLQKQKDKFVHDQNFTKFFNQVRTRTMDDFTYLIPRIMSDDAEYPHPNTQHPSEDVRYGEYLIKQVYEELRNSDYWNETLLVLVYDEHGGFWDSVPPTRTVANPSPNKVGTPIPFSFERLGPRVPAIIVSPWVQHSVVYAEFDHSAISATVKGLWNLKTPYLTARAEQQAHFVTPSTLLTAPRTDCPKVLPEVFPSDKDVPMRPTAPNHLRDNVMDQVKSLGSLLVNQGVIPLEQYLEIAENKLTTSESVVQFMTEAKELLGFKQDIKNREEFEKNRLIFVRKVVSE